MNNFSPTMAYFHGETLYDIHDMYFYDLQMAIEIPLPPLTEPMKILIGWQRALMENLTFFIFEYQVWNPLFPTFKPKFKIWAHANVEICGRTKTIELVRKYSLLLRNHWKKHAFSSISHHNSPFWTCFLAPSKIEN